MNVLANNERLAAVTVIGRSSQLPPVKVQTDDGQEFPGLLFGWPSGSEIRLIVEQILLGLIEQTNMRPPGHAADEA